GGVRGLPYRDYGTVAGLWLPPVFIGAPTSTVNPVAVLASTRTKKRPSAERQVSPTLNIEPSLFEMSAGGTSASWLFAMARYSLPTAWMITASPASAPS